jgi:hypothetical protein
MQLTFLGTLKPLRNLSSGELSGIVKAIHGKREFSNLSYYGSNLVEDEHEDFQGAHNVEAYLFGLYKPRGHSCVQKSRSAPFPGYQCDYPVKR